MTDSYKTNSDGNTMTTLAKSGTSTDGYNDTEEARKEMDRKDMEKVKAEREERFMNLFEGGKEYTWEELCECLDEMEREETEGKEAEKKGLGKKERKKLKRKEQLERKESERKEMERKETERKESERIEMERKEKNRKETERKESERMELERKEKERRETVRREMERKELERKEIERKESERKEIERQELMIQLHEAKGEIVLLKDVIKRMCSEWSLADGRWERKEGLESERKKKVLERKEMSSTLRKSTPPSSVPGRVRDMFAALGAGRKEEKTKGSNVGRKKEGCNREGRMKRMGEEKEKELGKKEAMEVLRRRNIELVAQLREAEEESAYLFEQMWKKTPGMSSPPCVSKVKETRTGATHMGVRDVQVVLPVKETRNERMATPAVSGPEDGWRVVARRRGRGGGTEDDFSSLPLPPRPPRPPLRKREIVLAGFDALVATCEIVKALSGIGGYPKEDIRMGRIRSRSNGSGTVWAQLPVAAALKVARKGRICVGRTAARVELLKTRPLQCFKCWSFGHMRDACSSAANRWGACYKCGQEGHFARECMNSVHCAACLDAGMETHHRMGGPLCAAVKRPGTLAGGARKGRKEFMERKEVL